MRERGLLGDRPAGGGHAGAGAYAVIPGSAGIPPWATALIVIGVLLTAAVVVLIIRTRGHRQTG